MRTFFMRCLAGALCLGAAAFSQEIYEPLPDVLARLNDESAHNRERVNASAYSVCMFAKTRACIIEFDVLDTVFISVRRRLLRAAIIQGFFDRTTQYQRAKTEHREAMRQYEALKEKYKPASSKATSTFFSLP